MTHVIGLIMNLIIDTSMEHIYTRSSKVEPIFSCLIIYSLYRRDERVSFSRV
jgi:hypothetical protein